MPLPSTNQLIREKAPTGTSARLTSFAWLLEPFSMVHCPDGASPDRKRDELICHEGERLVCRGRVWCTGVLVDAAGRRDVSDAFDIIIERCDVYIWMIAESWLSSRGAQYVQLARLATR